MDFLSTILRTANAEEYIQTLKDHGVDAFTLKILSEQDLEVIGIQEEIKRKAIINHLSKLQIPSEKLVEVKIDEQYVQLVLHQIYQQLRMHVANLSCAVNRNDVIICDLKLNPSVKCLQNTARSFENKVVHFDKKYELTKGKSGQRRSFKIVSSLLIISLSAFLVHKLLLR